MKKFRFAIVMCIFCMLLVACGNDDKDAESSTAVTTSSTASLDETTPKAEIEISTTIGDSLELPIDKPIELPFVPVN